MKWRDPDEAARRLLAVVQRQSGYFTSRQAQEAGYSRRLHSYHVQRGHWIRIDRGIYRHRDLPWTPHEEYVRWFLWSRGQAVISHDAAAFVHDLGDPLPTRVHLTVPPGFRKRTPESVVLHRTRLTAEDVMDAHGFRVTTPLRTLVDLLRSPMEDSRVASVLADALHRGRLRAAQVRERVSEMDLVTRGRAARMLEDHARAL